MNPWVRQAYDERGRCLCLVCRTKRGAAFTRPCDCLLCAGEGTDLTDIDRIIHADVIRTALFPQDTLYLRELEDFLVVQRLSLEQWHRIGRRLQVIPETRDTLGQYTLPASTVPVPEEVDKDGHDQLWYCGRAGPPCHYETNNRYEITYPLLAY